MTVLLVECLEKHGRVAWRERVILDESRHRFTIGRSVAADVTVDDPHVAPFHLAISRGADGGLYATDAGSINGFWIGDSRHLNAHNLKLASNALQIGATHLRIRSEEDELQPELPYRAGHAWLNNVNAIAAAAIIGAAIEIAYASWLPAPRDLAGSVALIAAAAAGVIAVWVGLWALLSRVMLGEWRWIRHTAIAVGTCVVATAGVSATTLGLYALSLPSISPLWLNALAVGALLFLHLRTASHLSVRRSATIAAILPLLLVAGRYWMYERVETRDVNFISSRTTVYPRYVRLRDAQPVGDFFRDAKELRARSDRKLADALAAEGNPDK